MTTENVRTEMERIKHALANKKLKIKELSAALSDRDAQIEKLTAQLSEARAEKLKEYQMFQGLLSNVAQLLDGWHADGTSWTEWDESIRQTCSEVQKKIEDFLASKGKEEGK